MRAPGPRMALQVLALSGLACSPVAPADGEPKFSVDTTQEEVVLPVRGDRAGFKIVGRLASPHGMRQLVLVGGGTEQEIAPGGWNLPACGARSEVAGADLDAIAVCWNALLGGDPSVDRMPLPREGLALLCRYRSADGALGPPLNVGFEAPTWLRTVGEDPQGTFVVEMLRDGNGTFFGRPSPGDGLYRVRLSGGAAGSPVLVQAR